MLDIAILDGVRTPFVKAFGALVSVPAQELGRRVVVAALERAGVKPGQVDQTVFGNVASPAEAANVSRVIALTAGIPQDRPAHTVHRNCASGLEALMEAAQLIQLGEATTIVAGGTESMSRIPLFFNDEAAARFMELARARGFPQRVRALLRFRPRHFKPVVAIKVGLTDPVSGLIMGETAEVLAEEFAISRQQQDSYALESHRRAVAAQKRGLFDEEIIPIPTSSGEVRQDVGPRADQSLESLAKLKPYFKRNGTVTVGNSCQITDGAAALVLMNGAAARAAALQPLGYVRAYAAIGCDPRRMGLGPVYATAKLLDHAKLKLTDIDLIEMNEAFAVQILANEKAFASVEFARKELHRDEPLGTLDLSKVNVNGGAIALGHPVGSTGARLALTLLKEMRRRDLHRGIATLCVGGGQGAALLVERA